MEGGGHIHESDLVNRIKQSLMTTEKKTLKRISSFKIFNIHFISHQKYVKREA